MEKVLKKLVKKYLLDQSTDSYYNDEDFTAGSAVKKAGNEKKYRPRRQAGTKAMQTVQKALKSDEVQNFFFNPFIPEFLKWTLPFLNSDMLTDTNRSFSLKSKTEWQTVYTQMRWLVTSHLIWIYTVCIGMGFSLSV